MTYPDNTEKSITLPYEFQPVQVGTYNLNVIASKESYKTVTDKEQFGVIKEEAKIEEVEVPPLEEDSQKPAPELPPEVEEAEKSKSYIYFTLAALIVMAAVVAYFVLNKRKIK